MGEYKYITYLKKNSELLMDDLYDLESEINWCLDNEQYLNDDYYDLILVVFLELDSPQCKFIKYGTKIKTCIDMGTLQIENNYLQDNKYSPYVLVKLSNDKFGYINTKNFVLTEFENQEQIKDKLLEFLLSNNSP